MPDTPNSEAPSNITAISTEPHQGSAPQTALTATDTPLAASVAAAAAEGIYLAGLAQHLEASAALVATAEAAARQAIQQEAAQES